MEKRRNSKILTYLTLFLIILIGFYLRYLLVYKDDSFIFDEGFNFIQAQNSVRTLITGQYSDVPIHPPLHYLFLHFWSKLSVKEQVLRLPFVIFGTISIYLFFLVGKQFFKSSLYGLVAAFLYASSAFSIYYSAQVRYLQALIMVGLLDFYFYLKAIETKRLKDWLIFGVFAGAALYLDYSVVWLLLIVNLHFLTFLFKKKWGRSQIKNWFIANFVIFLIFLPWLSIFFTNLPRSFEYTNYLGTPDFLSLIRLVVTFSSTGLGWIAEHVLSEGERVIYLLPILLSFLLLVTLGKSFKSKEKEKTLLVFLFFVPLLLSFLISQFSTKLFQDRNLAIVSIGVLLLVVSSLRFSPNLFTKIISAISLTLFLATNLRSLTYLYNNRLGESWREPALYLERELRENDTLVAHEGANEWPMLYYLKYRHPYPFQENNISLYSFEKGGRDRLFSSIMSGRYWLFGSSWEIDRDIGRLGPEGDFWLRFVAGARHWGFKEERFRLIDKETIGGITIYEGYYSN
ncbi:glycosyltransferase family 39 protein [Candidatus Microgenomates bacterium]|nr:glycosyltransferase family 39 protein [Candidatus Microgenomates bacterium]